ncbi:hypothetical protein GK047_12290 [Paenibacillus sp. SYP-B3998]|uniref:Lipoprotein n=1 Tax=Paenibacillus sp. SYP-B3998 TaxID=2678564 RepID=A0A6G3ZXD0_9BACL|nr:hypothetical protein [Paenibacillus sp. SYP-B3998]NEW06792.1 hypothetical protein [Paenibacillus sp. SYP-B3998]
MRKLLHYRVWLALVWISCGSLISGCWDSHDINLRTMPVIMGIAKGSSHRYEVTLQIPIPVEKGLSMKIVSQSINCYNGCRYEATIAQYKKAIMNDVTTFFKYSNPRPAGIPKYRRQVYGKPMRPRKTSFYRLFALVKKRFFPSLDPLCWKREDDCAIEQRRHPSYKLKSNNYYGAAVEVLENANITLESAKMRWSARLTKEDPTIDGKLFIRSALTESKEKATINELVSSLQSLMTDQYLMCYKRRSDKIKKSAIYADPICLEHFVLVIYFP